MQQKCCYKAAVGHTTINFAIKELIEISKVSDLPFRRQDGTLIQMHIYHCIHTCS